MPRIAFVTASGDEHVVIAPIGGSVMTSAVQNGVPGIVGECGGNNSCATCHVWVRADYRASVGAPGDLEDDLLDMAVGERRDGSRLACQIVVTDDLDGLVVDLPASQY